MAAHEATLLGREEIVAGTMVFRFSRPAGFSFSAGQSADFALPGHGHRIFSIASAPHEPELAVATRMRDGSDFKQALRAAPLGTKIVLKGPRGIMTLHEDTARAAVFLAGGIGITPFISMLRQARADRVVRPLFLLYSNRNAGSAAFLDELRSIERAVGSFRMLARMTDTDGPLDAAAIQGFVAEARKPVYYLAGPPGMVAALGEIVTRSGVSEDDVQSEEFYGYA